MTSILHGPNSELPFHISTDASNATIGVVLSQEEGKKPHVIYYISKNIDAIELNYTETEK